MRTTSIRKWLGVAVACVIFLCSGVSSSNAEPGKELDDFEFDDDGENEYALIYLHELPLADFRYYCAYL